MASKEIICAFGTDIDSVAGWIGSYGGGDSPSDIQRGIFASEVGVPRLLKLFKKYDLKTSFFIPGHSLETFPSQCKRIVDEGHEIGAHGYLHENPVAMTPTQEEAVLVKSIELIEKISGSKPRGYVAPWWEMSASTAALFPALLRARRRYLERHRLFQEGRRLDASAQAWQGDRPGRGRRQLVCR
jgi:peptidoglycan/xylan/chitin deacetylase (PgdA/CDA1 family)